MHTTESEVQTVTATLNLAESLFIVYKIWTSYTASLRTQPEYECKNFSIIRNQTEKIFNADLYMSVQHPEKGFSLVIHIWVQRFEELLNSVALLYVSSVLWCTRTTLQLVSVWKVNFSVPFVPKLDGTAFSDIISGSQCRNVMENSQYISKKRYMPAMLWICITYILTGTF